jgi:HSP20 family protein
MSRDLVRLTHALFLPQAEACLDSPWCPAVDVYRTRRGFLVKFDLAGIRVEDIELQRHGQRLTIRGVRRDCTTQEGCSYYRMEIAYSRFERSLDLPCDLERADLTVEYRDGMLLVSIVPAAGKQNP